MAEILVIVTVVLIVVTIGAAVYGVGSTVAGAESNYFTGARQLASAHGLSVEPADHPLPDDLHETAKDRYINYGWAEGGSYRLRGNWQGIDVIYIPGRNRLSMRTRSGWELYSVFYFRMPAASFPDFFLRARLPVFPLPSSPLGLFECGAMRDAYPEFSKYYRVESEDQETLRQILPEPFIRHLTDIGQEVKQRVYTWKFGTSSLPFPSSFSLWSVRAFAGSPWIEIEEVILDVLERPPQDFLKSLNDAHRIVQILTCLDTDQRSECTTGPPFTMQPEPQKNFHFRITLAFTALVWLPLIAFIGYHLWNGNACPPRRARDLLGELYCFIKGLIVSN